MVHIKGRPKPILRPVPTAAVPFCLFLLMAVGCTSSLGFTVNSSGDAGDSSPGDGSCRTAASASECTLRAAIEEANALAGKQVIAFNLPDGDTSIYPSTPLPEITAAAAIFGITQPGFDGDNPIVQVDGSLMAAPPPVDGFRIADSVDATINGLQILNFTGNGILSEGDLDLDHMEIAGNMDKGVFSDFPGSPIDLTISNSTICENEDRGLAGVGTFISMDYATLENNQGGLLMQGGRLIMNHSIIADNTTSGDGGGINLFWITSTSIRNTTIERNTSDQNGGGLYALDLLGGDILVENSTFDGNSAYDGGAIYIGDGATHLSAATLINNRADRHGGGVFVAGDNDPTLWIEDGSVIGRPGEGNIANNDPVSSGLGGGIYNTKDLYVSSSTVESNTGDGIFNAGGDLTVFNSDAKNNLGSGINSLGGSVMANISDINDNLRHGVEMTADAAATEFEAHQSLFNRNGMHGFFGTGVDALIVDSSFRENGAQAIRMDGGQLSLWRSTVAENAGSGIYLNLATGADIKQTTINGNSTAGTGGGLLIEGVPGGAYLLENVTIHANNAGPAGGGLELTAGTATLNNVTLTDNSALEGGGIHSTGEVIIGNSIVADNTGGNCSGAITSAGYNIDDSTTCPFASPGDQTGTAIPLGPLADNGGPTFTRAIFSPGAAFDTGDDATCAVIDQRDVPRPQAMHCDVGAFELEARGKSASTPDTPTFTPTPEPTGTPTLTPTDTAILAAIVFDPVIFSSDVIYDRYSYSCDPKELIVQVKVSPAESVKSLGLFYRLEEKEGTNITSWSQGLAMFPQGGGWHTLTIYSEDFPADIYQWNNEALLAIQFVANGPDGEAIGRSAVFRQVTVSRCAA